MEFMSGGKSKPGTVKKSRVETRAMKIKQVVADDVDESALPTKIEVPQKGSVGAIVPGHVWKQGAFRWDPQTFVLESDELNQKFIEPSVQDSSLTQFLKKPGTAMIYGVTGNPDDAKAKLFAAYLMQAHIKRFKSNANPWWVPLYGGFDNPWLDKDRARPTMIVLCNLTAQSTNQRLEKARDIIEAYQDVPRIVVAAGCDPMSFLATKLRVPVHGLAYFSEAIVKAKVQVI